MPTNINLKPVTLADIGREAGVTRSVVSRVLLNRPDRIPQQTRASVHAAAQRLGYRPNLLIRGAQTGRSMNIGVVVPPTGSFYGKIVQGIHDEFQQNSYCVLLAWNPQDTETVDTGLERALIHRLVDRRADGIILRPNHAGVSDVYFAEVQKRRIPLVTVDRPLPGVHCDFAGTDDELGARLAARHLLEAGHRRLAHLAVDSPFAPALLRQKGFEEECATVPAAVCRTVRIARYGDHALVQSAAEKLLRASDRPTAISLASDDLTLGVYRAARQLGLRVPADLSVVGFGNLDQDEFTNPSLTSIDQNAYEMGKNAARLILQRIQGEAGEVRQVRSEPVLVARESVAVVKHEQGKEE